MADDCQSSQDMSRSHDYNGKSFILGKKYILKPREKLSCISDQEIYSQT